MKRLGSVVAMVIGLAGALGGSASAQVPLKLVTRFAMPATVAGRFDHLSVDTRGHRLFVAAETSHAVLVFDLRTGTLVHTIGGIQIPHAVFCREDLNRLYITDGGEGTLKIYDGRTYQLLKTVPLKVDADSVTYDAATHDLYIVNGGGDAHETFSMVSAVNTTSGEKVAEMKIDGRTLEAMAIERGSDRLYVNNAANNLIDVVDRKTHTLVTTWPVTGCEHNVAMALDASTHRLFTACRSGAIAVFDTSTGRQLQTFAIGKGVDDLVFDPASRRLYAACGADGGATFVYREEDPDHYTLVGQVPSGPGGKNEALVPSAARLYITVPPREGTPGAVYVFRVQGAAHHRGGRRGEGRNR